MPRSPIQFVFGVMPILAAIALALRLTSQVPISQAAAAAEPELHSPGWSFNPSPVEFSLGGVLYRIPRNYLIEMSEWKGKPQGAVTLRFNLADLKPLTEETKDCLYRVPRPSDVTPNVRAGGCAPVDLQVFAGGLTADQIFSNMRGLFHSPEPMTGPTGFENT